MPASPPLPRRLKLQAPENGYESPHPPESDDENAGNGTHRVEQRRRARYSSGDTTVAAEESESTEHNSTTFMRSGRDLELETKKIGIRDRIGCYTWTWFTMTMATGGIANVLHSIPYKSDWLRILGVIVFLFNLCLFLGNCILIILRFKWNPGSLRASFTSPSESLFIPASVVSVGTILINMCQYGIPQTGAWFHTAMQVCYWLYFALSVLASSGMYLIIWSTQSFPIHQMTPIWIFPAYPLLLMTPFAANLIDALPDSAAASRINSVAIAFGAICLQGSGFLLSLMIYSAFIYRLMTQKLPRETTRPGMFVSVGPSGFTVAGIVLLGSTVSKIMPNGYLGNSDAGFFFKLLSMMTGLWLWGLCLWFFLVSLGAHWQLMRPSHPEYHIHYDMTWFSFVFPNTALVTATIAIGKAFDSAAIKIFGTVIAVLLVIVWMVVFFMMVRAFLLRRILWPGELDGAEASAKRWGLTGRAVPNGNRRGHANGGATSNEAQRE